METKVKIARCHIFLLGHQFITTPLQDPVMQNSTCKNKLNLDGVRMEWLIIQNLENILQSSKCPINTYSKAGAPNDDLDTLFSEGFLHQTKERGLVVMSWAPQQAMLAHGAVGGFVTHCGWNSVLEAVMAGVPMLAWPLYAEQRTNKVFLVEEMRLAVGMKGYDKEMVEAQEVAAKVRWLIESDGGRELRQRAHAAMRLAKEAVDDGGESRTVLLQLAREWRNAGDSGDSGVIN